MIFLKKLNFLLKCKENSDKEETTAKYKKKNSWTHFNRWFRLFSKENLYYLFKHKINALIILPKKLSEDHDNKLSCEKGHEEKRKGSSKKRF